MSATTVPYIGSQISLISKSDIRYEGTLHSIDPNEHTVSLSNVRSFGTENRRIDGKQIPASNDLYEFIIFRGSDIKDLSVIQATPILNDSAIIKANIKENQPNLKNPQPEKEFEPQQRYENRHNQRQYQAQIARGELHENINEDLKEELKEDFDFQEEIPLEKPQKNESGKGYDKKSSFFDNISCKSSESEVPFDRRKQKEMDNETFGEDYVADGERELRRSLQRGRRRGNRGQYRAGRGEFRGNREGGYREGGYREGGYREGGYREGGYREGGYREGGYREGGYREGGYNRNFGQ
ncbi:unnamed protein product [Blepharisma stoltei]|uniref:Uncharacterized protein n=1 Tax=Blepharisma stoltei TaxID=1481888 RepID=A0AAU9JHF1_9CILI|nr:unnamed protein product [Blepharisma stoltei]